VDRLGVTAGPSQLVGVADGTVEHALIDRGLGHELALERAGVAAALEVAHQPHQDHQHRDREHAVHHHAQRRRQRGGHLRIVILLPRRRGRLGASRGLLLSWPAGPALERGDLQRALVAAVDTSRAACSTRSAIARRGAGPAPPSKTTTRRPRASPGSSAWRRLEASGRAGKRRQPQCARMAQTRGVGGGGDAVVVEGGGGGYRHRPDQRA
jgi:hypothetical protein